MIQDEKSLGSALNIDQDTQDKLSLDTKKFIIKGTKLIHSEQTRDKVINSLDTGGSPLESVANTTVAIVQRLDEAARQAGDDVHDIVRIQGAHDLLNQIADVGAASGKIKELSPEERNAAFSIAVEKYLKSEIQAGRIDPAALKAELSRSVKSMPPDEQQAISSHLTDISKTAMGSVPQQQQSQQGSMLGGM